MLVLAGAMGGCSSSAWCRVPGHGKLPPKTSASASRGGTVALLQASKLTAAIRRRQPGIELRACLPGRLPTNLCLPTFCLHLPLCRPLSWPTSVTPISSRMQRAQASSTCRQASSEPAERSQLAAGPLRGAAFLLATLQLSASYCAVYRLAAVSTGRMTPLPARGTARPPAPSACSPPWQCMPGRHRRRPVCVLGSAYFFSMLLSAFLSVSFACLSEWFHSVLNSMPLCSKEQRLSGRSGCSGGSRRLRSGTAARQKHSSYGAPAFLWCRCASSLSTFVSDGSQCLSTPLQS